MPAPSPARRWLPWAAAGALALAALAVLATTRGPAAPPAAPAPAAPTPPEAPPAVAAPPAPGEAARAFDPHRLPEEESLRTIRALVDRRPIEALGYLRRLEEAFPDSAHRVERERWMVEALANLGRMQEARARGEALMATKPDGNDAWRVQYLLDNVIPK